ncbi:hypothetical protein Acr_27g0009150 [Actinidia rufa]|uniref:Transducin/WD40 repeat-like superfamily protein n=1 Tax=Actinidia rufa TaxID=165716 RepID=A0A7J0H7X2_9ERIC|nr:hypothetical protein Acr_27g0009150 [Actinidia rufa]
MAVPSSSITDMNMDSLVHCADYLSLRDISSLAMSCKYLRRVAYSDSIWLRFSREQWPEYISSGFTQTSSVREAYLARHTAVQQFKFVDPLVADLYTEPKPYNHLFLNKNDIVFSQGSCQRCFRGHNGPVSALSDKLLGNGNGKIFASGGVDATVRLWSLSSSGKRGQHALKATLYGHEKPVVLMSVAGHKISLLVSISKDSKVRVWDTTTSSAVRSSCCVGTTSVPGAPVGMRCHESLVYAAAGSSVVAIDLRTMQKVFTVAIQQGDLHSFEIIPSKLLICAGGTDRALLWDVRKTSETPKAEPVAELDGHTGAVTHLHMDPYKIVTGGPEDSYINVWETDTGTQTNSLICCSPDISSSGLGCSAMAVNGCQIVTAGCGEELGLIRYRDFKNATCHVSSNESGIASKFWEPQSYSDSDEVDG